jgi:hypothetical protein
MTNNIDLFYGPRNREEVMTAIYNVHEALRRLLAVEWATPPEGRPKSHVALMREYLRRAALWGEKRGRRTFAL